MAVLAADVAGYSRLVGADEEGSLVQWRAHWHALIQIVPTLHPPDRVCTGAGSRAGRGRLGHAAGTTLEASLLPGARAIEYAAP
jgi:hypothetical protein